MGRVSTSFKKFIFTEVIALFACGSCVCKLGFSDQVAPGTECYACPANTFKDTLGNASCSDCRTGLVSYEATTSEFGELFVCLNVCVSCEPIWGMLSDMRC